ncbi:ribosome-binding factor A [Mycoplasmoides fastidiosum]|uniref:Ribosome-binding factor A n=1 Tax=Mycoplasmoides fastidiosum TaxID=92758 RepID=A0ABU0LYA2_9BACT|nr:30S ribosome-binding factor RbfA [Mycoplasmoides fastidiosum]MDQ0513662.1 ribosome-binding factor A [Mycoplasmoides fastidiosum]UUD37918.1 30S ribosome-binding factor RbfA [Mycoplasmoides fastidiosum]
MKETRIQIRRLEKTIFRILNETLVSELDDSFFMTIAFTAVKLSNDKSWLTVYVDHLDPENASNAIAKLDAVKGLFRNKLAQELTIYRIPQIKFVFDEVIEHANKIEALINESLKKIKD